MGVLVTISFAVQSFAQEAEISTNESGTKFGLLVNKQMVLEPIYSKVKNIYWGEGKLYFVQNEQGKVALYNCKTKQLTAFRFDDIRPFKEVDFPVDAKGNIMLSSTFENDYLSNNKPFKIVEESGDMRITYVDKNAKYTHIKTDVTITVKSSILGVVQIDGKYGVVNDNGDLMVAASYDEISSFNGDFNQTCWARKGDSSVLLNSQFKPMKTFSQVSIVNAPFSGCAVVVVEEKTNSHFAILGNLGEFICEVSANTTHGVVIDYIGDYEFLIIEKNNLWSAILLFTPEKCEVITSKSSRDELYDAMVKYAEAGW